MRLVNNFGYSLSRESMFDACKRRYYFHYYLSWGGWKRTSPGIVREAFKLKRLVSLPLWRGQLVHYVTAKVLQSMKARGRIPNIDDVVKYALEQFQRQFDFSSAGKYLTEPKKRGRKLNIDWLALFDHEYKRKLDSELIDRTRQECVQGIKGLFQSPILETISQSDPTTWIIEDLDHSEFSQNFDFDGVTVYAKTDFMFYGKDGTFNIVDWKTHRPADSTKEEPTSLDARVQLGIYGYYASNVLLKALHLIRLQEVNLLSGGEIKEYSIDEESLELCQKHIEKGISKLSSMLVKGDIARNEPLTAEHFPKIENGLCRFCNFFRICKDEGYPSRLP